MLHRRMLLLLPLAAIAVAALPGCVVGHTYGRPHATVVHRAPVYFDARPELVVVSPGLEVVVDYDYEVFVVDGWWWTRYDGVWYRSHTWDGNWTVVRTHYVPSRLRSVPRGRYRRYRPAHYHPRDRVVRPGHPATPARPAARPATPARRHDARDWRREQRERERDRARQAREHRRDAREEAREARAHDRRADRLDRRADRARDRAREARDQGRYRDARENRQDARRLERRSDRQERKADKSRDKARKERRKAKKDRDQARRAPRSDRRSSRRADHR